MEREATPTSPPHAVDDDARALGRDVRRGVAAVYRRFRSLRAHGELGESATEVLAAITVAEPLTLSELADRDRVALSTISQTVNRLEKLGYVVRETDTVDRRRVRIVPTAAGAAIAASDRAKRHAWFDRRIADLDPADRAALERAAQILQELAEA
ncbi:MarR family winged helix-turn-helix transcriptional regulator [Microbacterium sp. NPDC091313]